MELYTEIEVHETSVNTLSCIFTIAEPHMSLPTGYHIQLIITNSNGEVTNLLPISTAADIKLDSSGNINIPATVETVQALANSLGSLAFMSTLPAASTSASGVVQLSNSTNDTTEERTAATTKAVSEVSAVANAAVPINGDTNITGTKNFMDGVKVSDMLTIQTSIDGADKVTTFSVQPGGRDEDMDNF